MALDVSQIVRVTTRIATGGVPRLAFNRGLLLTLDDGLAPSGSGKVRLFTSASDVLDALGAGVAYDAAAIWFAADPQPQGLYIGRWAEMDFDTILRGSTAARVFTTGVLNSANAAFSLNGNDVTVNLSSSSDGMDVATALQTAINSISGITGTVVEFANNQFTVTFNTPLAVQGGGLGNHSTAAATDQVAAALGLDAASVNYLPGTDAETAVEALNTILDSTSSGEPVYLLLAEDAQAQALTDDAIDDIRTWAQANEVVYGLRTTEDLLLTAGETTSEAALANAANQQYVAAAYTAPGQYPDIGLMARMSSQDFNQPASIISPVGDTLPGVEPVDLTSAQLAELARKNVNVYANVNGDGALLGGYTARTAYWLDAVVFLQWLRTELEAGIWRAMRASRRFTTGQLYDALTDVLETAVASGGLRPGGTVSAATKADIIQTTGNQRFDGTLSRGYLPWVQTTPTQADRDARIARFKVWVVGAEAIHSVVGDVTFTN